MPCKDPASPLVVAYGMGVDSTAMLVQFARLRILPGLILFADTGSEKGATYAYLPIIQEFLARHGLVPIEVVRRIPKRVTYRTLEEDCRSKGMLPSLAYGFKGCSLKWKRDPQDARVNHWQPAIDTWRAGKKVCKAIGYDAGCKDAKRSDIAQDKKYTYWYPLRDWGWDRQRCKQEIRAAGLPLPPKSACFFCPASKPWEIAKLVREEPHLAERICDMEAAAAPNLLTVEGLWRKRTKSRPGTMTEFIENLPPEDPLLEQVRARLLTNPDLDPEEVEQHLFEQGAEIARSLRERAGAPVRAAASGPAGHGTAQLTASGS